MISVNKGAKIYILCAPNFATGGPEALHQLGHQLNKMGIPTFMYYHPNNGGSDPVHAFYKDYRVPFVTEVDNRENNILVLPETSPEYIFERSYDRITKVIWWLSVTNYYKQLQPRIRRTKRKPLYWLKRLYNPIRFATLENIRKFDIQNIGHSFFSMEHLREAGITPVGQISDYMNHKFFDKIDSNILKEDMIIYNPVKNGEYLQKIIALTSGYRWVPLINLDPEEVAETMNRAKLYVDFGYHPGKERMPREACIMRCCMIVGKEGSASYTEDMPIPEKYRFEKTEINLQKIINTIHRCLFSYDQEIKNFDAYRKILYLEEQEFVEAVKQVFIKQI